MVNSFCTRHKNAVKFFLWIRLIQSFIVYDVTSDKNSSVELNGSLDKSQLLKTNKTKRYDYR